MCFELKQSIQLLWLIASLRLMSACGGASTPTPRRHQGVELGQIVQAVERLQQMPERTPCDEQHASVQIEIARALDARATQIGQSLTNLGESGKERAVDVGPMSLLRAYDRPADIAGMPRRTVTQDGWHLLQQHLELAQAHAHKKGGELLWPALQMRASALIVDDMRRLSGQRLGIFPDSLSAARALQRQAQDCWLLGRCAEVAPDGPGHDDIQALYGAEIGAIRAAPHAASQRHAAQKLWQRLGADLEIYVPHPNAAISKDDGILTLPLDPGDFAAHKQVLQDLIEQTWRGADLRVRVQWTRQSDNPLAYRFCNGKTPGGRSYADTDRLVIMLYPWSLTTTVTHEIGHALGLPDRYYTRWQPHACLYEYYADDGDIMSDSSFTCAQPQAVDWEYFADTYEPLPASAK